MSLLLPFLPLLLLTTLSSPQPLPLLPSSEQESLYQVLTSINPTTNWRSLYPDDLCNYGPHGILCDYFLTSQNLTTLHVTELNFGYLSDYSPNPSCSPNSSFSPSLSSFPNLRKLFFYKCFTQTPISLPPFLSKLSTTLQHLIFIENPSLSGSLGTLLNTLSFPNLQRLVFSGTNVSGEVPVALTELTQLEQVTLSRSRFNGTLPLAIGKLKNLRILDLSYNEFEGNLPDSIGEMGQLWKLDLGSNGFNGRIPETFMKLQKLEFLDLSYNSLNGGVPLALGEMGSLKEMYLSGNRQLGGQVPEIWEKLGGISGLGLSGLGLVGNIPVSMGVFLRNVSYLGLDDNILEGTVPGQFGKLENVNEMNLENNKLIGKLVLSSNFSCKLKMGGNAGLCVEIEHDEDRIAYEKSRSRLGYLNFCSSNKSDDVVIPLSVLSSSGSGQAGRQYCFSVLLFLLVLSFVFVLC